VDRDDLHPEYDIVRSRPPLWPPEHSPLPWDHGSSFQLEQEAQILRAANATGTDAAVWSGALPCNSPTMPIFVPPSSKPKNTPTGAIY